MGVFGPPPLKNLLLAPQDLREFVLAKCILQHMTLYLILLLVHNGILTCLVYPPLLPLLSRPRGAAMNEVVEKYQTLTKGKLCKSMKKEQDKDKV